MKKFRKVLLSLVCALIIGGGIVSSVNAASYSKTATVSGGKIYAYATYHETGNTRWSHSYGSTLNSYTNVKSSGVNDYKSPVITDNKLTLYAQLYKVDYSYNTTKLGTNTFTFTR